MRLYFERLSLWHLPLVLIARAAGVSIGAFDPDLRLRTTPIIGALARRGVIKRVVTWSWGTSHSDAIAWADLIVEQQSRHPLIAACSTLYGDDEIKLVFKRCLAERLSQSFEIAARFHRDCEMGVMQPTLLIAPQFGADMALLKKHGFDTALFPSGVRMLALGRGVGAFSRFFATLAIVAAAALRLATQIWRTAPPVESRPRSIGWSISTAFQTRFQGPRRFDFIIDENQVRSEDVVYLVEVPLADGVLQNLRLNDRNVVDLTKVSSFRHLARTNASGAWVKRALKVLPTFIWFAWRSAHFADGTQTCLAMWLKWQSAWASVRFKRYVTTNNENRGQIASTVLLRSLGVETIAYSQFIGGPYQLRAPFDRRNVYWSFLNYDTHAINNAAMRDCFREHRQRVRRYELIGNLFAEMISGRRNSNVCAGTSTVPPIVAIFDTTFVDEEEFPTNYDDCARFLVDLIRLADERPDLRFKFKPAKPHSYFTDAASPWASPVAGLEISRLRKELGSRSNVELQGHERDPVDVMEDAGLVITHCFSSPTADALSAGVPAIWYASTKKLSEYPLATLKNGTVFGFDALASRIDGLLAGKDVAWEAPNCAMLIEPYKDRRALTRLRQLLIASDADGAKTQRLCGEIDSNA